MGDGVAGVLLALLLLLVVVGAVVAVVIVLVSGMSLLLMCCCCLSNFCIVVAEFAALVRLNAAGFFAVYSCRCLDRRSSVITSSVPCLVAAMCYETEGV